jgi:uncharacterized protein (UPF0216 family)
MSDAKDQAKNASEKIKRHRGRPRKQKTLEELAKENKPKLTLAEKQEIKLKIQQEREAIKAAKGEAEPKNKDKFYCTNKELQAELIKWRDSAPKVEDRVISEELGRMLMAIANKILNHSNFRNYDKELKADMASYFYYKAIRGLKNYNFKFNNPFSWLTMCAFNSYLTIICKHYKHLNIKKDLMKKMISELETYNGISNNTSLTRCIKSYLGDELFTDN